MIANDSTKVRFTGSGGLLTIEHWLITLKQFSLLALKRPFTRMGEHDWRDDGIQKNLALISLCPDKMKGIVYGRLSKSLIDR